MINEIKKCKNYEKEDLNDKLSEIEANICKLDDIGGNVQPSGIWSIMRKLFPENRESLPLETKRL